MEKYYKKILWLAIVLYVVVFSLVSIYKYTHFLYNGIDLAIINNVFWNTVHGHWFWSSIQGHSYLGDHCSPILILLLPVYFLWQSPLLLLILQSVFLGLAAWPIYKIASKILCHCEEEQSDDVAISLREATLTGSRRPPQSRGPRDDSKTLALAIAVLWLINPLTHNINLHEFSFISLLPLAFFTLFYLYLRLEKESRNKKLLHCFIVTLLICLAIREDIAFIILIFSLIILFNLRQTTYDKRLTTNNLRHRVLLVVSCLLLSIAWLFVSHKIISAHSPSGFTPFAYYYSWLGSAGSSAIAAHILSYKNLEMIVGFLLPFLFIPLIKPKWLLLALIPLAQIILSASGGGAQVFMMHYGALFLPALVIAFIFGFHRANQFIKDKLKSKYLLLVCLMVTNIFLWVDFGIFKKEIYPERSELSNTRQANINETFKSVVIQDKTASILASYRFLANLSSRENIYALHYYFLGVQQFAQGPYTLNKKPEYVILDKNDLLDFEKNLKNSKWAGKYYENGQQGLRELLKDYGVVDFQADVVLFKRGYKSEIKLDELNLDW